MFLSLLVILLLKTRNFNITWQTANIGNLLLVQGHPYKIKSRVVIEVRTKKLLWLRGRNRANNMACIFFTTCYINTSRKDAMFFTVTESILINVWFKRRRFSTFVFPSVFFNHMGKFYNEFAFFILLTRFVCLFILPAKSCFTTITVYVSHSMKARKKDAFFGWTAANIYHRVE